jgi:ABC-2 type transport system permease protein
VNVAVLLLAWAGLTLLLPASVSAIAEAVHPLPSRPAWLAEAREIEVQTELAESDAVSRFIVDHPELVFDEASEMPAYVRTAFLATRAVDEATRPILRSFELAASGREASLSFMRYLSPAIAVHGVLADISGSSARRHRDFMAHARAMKADYAERAGRAIVAGRRLALDEARALPDARLHAEASRAILARNGDMLAFLIVVTALLLLLANWRLRRMEVPV